MLKREMTRQGAWLFRWRSYLLVLPLAVSVFQDTGWMAVWKDASHPDGVTLECIKGEERLTSGDATFVKVNAFPCKDAEAAKALKEYYSQ